MSTAQNLQGSIRNEIEKAIQHRCGCHFYSWNQIYSGEFSCQTTTSDVVYRAIIKGTSDLHTAAELLDYIAHWRKNNQTLLHNIFRLRLSQDCPLQISSFDEVECIGTNKENSDKLECDKHHDNSNSNRNLLLGSGTCYRFEACDDGSTEYLNDSSGSGGYYDGHNSLISKENNTITSGGDRDDGYLGDISGL